MKIKHIPSITAKQQEKFKNCLDKPTIPYSDVIIIVGAFPLCRNQIQACGKHCLENIQNNMWSALYFFVHSFSPSYIDFTKNFTLKPKRYANFHRRKWRSKGKKLISFYFFPYSPVDGMFSFLPMLPCRRFLTNATIIHQICRKIDEDLIKKIFNINKNFLRKCYIKYQKTRQESDR